MNVMVRHFEAVSKIAPLPDCRFLINLGDGLSGAMQVPIFCFSKKKTTPNTILMPDPLTLDNCGRLQKRSNKGTNFTHGRAKLKRFWRGATTGGLFNQNNYLQFPRSKLVKLSLDHPGWVDARFTSLSQGAEKINSFEGFKGERVPVKEHLKYKYQILIDGNTCSWERGFWQLFSGCVMFKQESDYIQWYYRAMKSGEHYIPVNKDMSNLIEKAEMGQGAR